MRTVGSIGGVDRISCLPDDLLLSILVRVADTAAAARTSVLSHRWRHVWVHLHELFFRYQVRHGQVSARARAHERVDAALAAHAGTGTTTAVTLLEVTLPRWAPQAPVAALDGGGEKAAAPWLLQFASQRVAGELRLSLPHDSLFMISRQSGEIVVPPCERATAITLDVGMLPLRFHLLLAATAGTFAALATLRIVKARVHSRELEDAVSSRCCPRLKELFLKHVALSNEPLVFSILSDSLERLEIVRLTTPTRLKVIAPKLEMLGTPMFLSSGAHIVAPKLSEVCWQGRYDPIADCIMEAGRHLQRLKIGSNISMAANLMLRFDTVHKLELTVDVREGIQKYQKYLEDVGKLCKCEVLVIRLAVIGHSIKLALLHLLKKCSGVKKIVVDYLVWYNGKCGCIPWECQCNPWILDHGEEDIIALDSLEHVEIGALTPAYHKVEIVRMLYQYSATFQNRVTVTLIENKERKYIQELHSICVPNDKLVINVQSTQAGRDCLKGSAASKR